MRQLALLVPSRERPGNIARLLEAMDATCRADTELVLGLDRDDPTLPEYMGAAGERDDIDIWIEDDLRGVVAWTNHLAAHRARDFMAVGQIGDDNVPRTVGWDVQIMGALERVPFCFGDDLYPGRATGTLCCHVFMRSSVVEALGYVGPPSLQHMYVDPTWMAWGKAVGIEFLPDVILEHMHYSVGKSAMDRSYEVSTATIPEDLARFNAYCADPGGLNADIEKLRGIPWGEEQIMQFKRDLNIPEQWPR